MDKLFVTIIDGEIISHYLSGPNLTGDSYKCKD